MEMKVEIFRTIEQASTTLVATIPDGVDVSNVTNRLEEDYDRASYHLLAWTDSDNRDQLFIDGWRIISIRCGNIIDHKIALWLELERPVRK